MTSTSSTLATRGPRVAKWIETYLVHAQGDYLGQPFKLRGWQRDFLNRLYAVDPVTKQRIVRKALLGLPKGNGKTELLAAVGLAELGGPTAPTSPDIVIAAASWDQADLLFGAAGVMVTEGPLRDHFEVMKDRIVMREKPGKLYRVAAVAGTNDGSRPHLFVCDEVHEWTGNKARVHTVIGNSLAKRKGGVELNISTAGFDKGSLLYRLYEMGRKVQTGEITDPGMLFVWHQASDIWDLDDPEQLLKAIREANPAADDFWPADNLVRRFREIPRHEFERYHLNRWVNPSDLWLPMGSWDDCLKAGPVPDGAEVILGFDGSRSNDSTALVVCSIEDTPHLDTVRCWEKPAQVTDWQTSPAEIMQAVREACVRWNVREIAADAWLWRQVLEQLQQEGYPVVEIPQQSSTMGPASQRFYEAVSTGGLTHSGEARLTRHVENIVPKTSSNGATVPTRDRSVPQSYIDLAIAAVMAFSRVAANNKPKQRARVISLADYLT